MDTARGMVVAGGVEHVAEAPLGATISDAQARVWRMKADRERIIRTAIGDWREIVKELEEAICYAEMELALTGQAQSAA